MSATELIKQVAALPPPERTLFARLFRAMEDGQGTRGQAGRARWPDFGERLDNIYGDRAAPDSQSIIDDGRGER